MIVYEPCIILYTTYIIIIRAETVILRPTRNRQWRGDLFYLWGQQNVDTHTMPIRQKPTYFEGAYSELSPLLSLLTFTKIFVIFNYLSDETKSYTC